MLIIAWRYSSSQNPEKLNSVTLDKKYLSKMPRSTPFPLNLGALTHVILAFHQRPLMMWDQETDSPVLKVALSLLPGAVPPKWFLRHPMSPQYLPEVSSGEGDICPLLTRKAQTLQWDFSNLSQLFCQHRIVMLCIKSSTVPNCHILYQGQLGCCKHFLK